MKKFISIILATAMLSVGAVFASSTVTAKVSTTTMVVNGDIISVDSYLIDGSNYIKLRDLATMINNSEKNFSVVWNNELSAIEMNSNTVYNATGSELQAGDGLNKQATATSSKIYIDGELKEFDAYLISGYNYLKLRDIMKTFDVYVGWENETSTATLQTAQSYVSSSASSTVDTLDFGVGQGIVWEDGIFAPFADITAWVTGEYSNNGALNLGKVMQDTGIKYYNIGFINAVDGTVDENGVLNWGFGAFDVLSEEYAGSNTQYQGIKQAISDVRAGGGDVAISIGGLNERNFYQYTTDLDVLVNTYIEIIDGFNLTRIDLDIEGGAQGYDMNLLNAQAMKIVQEKTGVEVVLTLPVLPTGLTEYLGLPTLQVYLDEGVDVKAVNIMAMCYGSYFGDYALGSVDAIDSTMQQIKDAYAKIGTTLTTTEAYNKVGVTTSIGYEGYGHPIFTTADSELVVNHAVNTGINFVSYWSLNRDTQTQSNDGIYSKYEHANVYLGFQDGSITVDPDYTYPEDTTKPEVTTPDTTTPDTTTPTIPDEVPDVEYSGGYPVWSREIEATGEYTSGYVVTYKGIVYSQSSTSVSWWSEPGTYGSVWTAIGVDTSYVAPEPTEWTREEEATGAYSKGTVVTYKGYYYTQISSSIAWWCEPGTDSSVWQVTGTDSSYVAPAPTAWTREVEATGAYTSGTTVTYNGKTYLQVSSSTAWWCEPGTDSSVWAVQ